MNSEFRKLMFFILFLCLMPASFIFFDMTYFLPEHEAIHEKIYHDFGCKNTSIEYSTFRTSAKTYCHNRTTEITVEEIAAHNNLHIADYQSSQIRAALLITTALITAVIFFEGGKNGIKT